MLVSWHVIYNFTEVSGIIDETNKKVEQATKYMIL